MIFEDLYQIIWLLLLIPPLIFLYFKRKPHGQLKFSTTKNLKTLKPSWTLQARHWLFVARVVAIALLVIGLMRPLQGIEETKVETEGIDIMLAIDVSGSMLAEDFVVKNERINRLEAVKNVVREFIQKRKNDRIGLVVFGGRAYMQCPLTLDYDVLLEFLDHIHIGMVEDGTAVGDGIATSLAKLRKIDSKSKVVILLTDGINNAGKVDPLNSAQLAEALDIKVYTIGAGSKGRVPFPARDFFGNKVYQWAIIDIDEASLQKIADMTGGKYFRATDTESLRQIYHEIDRLEKTKVEMDVYMEYRELFPPFVLIALFLILGEVALRYTRLRTLP